MHLAARRAIPGYSNGRPRGFGFSLRYGTCNLVLVLVLGLVVFLVLVVLVVLVVAFTTLRLGCEEGVVVLRG